VKDTLTYRDAGVDIEAGDAFAGSLGPLAKQTHRPEVLSSIGGFAGLFRPDTSGMEEPVLVSGTDGVGTKLMVAQSAGQHETIGIDLVAMCVNDVLTTGAEPLFFLDYYATGKLETGVGEQVLRGIAEGCKQAGCALLGGETAEMPGMYAPGKYDLAGFSVGLVDRPAIIDGSKIAAGDTVLGVGSSGLHSNGFSLVRYVLFEQNDFALEDQPSPLVEPLGRTLLTPTLIYSKALLPAYRKHRIHGVSHITGGGIAGNLTRILPSGVHAELDRSRWTEPPIFALLRQLGVPSEEMDQTFNLGLGLVVICPAAEAEAVTATISEAGVWCGPIGTITAGETGVTIQETA